HRGLISICTVGMHHNAVNTKQVKPVTEARSTSEIADLQTQIKILLSESLLGRVLDKLRQASPSGLSSEFPLLTGGVMAWRRAFHMEEPPPADRREDALKYAQKEVRVRATGLSRILEISADSADPAMAANFANTLANE